MTKLLRVLFFLIAVTFLGIIAGAQVNLPNTFRPGTVISAEQVNANFTSLAAAINQLSGSGVASVNGKTGALTIEAGANIAIDDSQQGRIIISATGGGTGATYQAGAGLRLAGSTFSVDAGYLDGIFVNDNYFGEGSLPASGRGSECTIGDVWLTAGSVSGGLPTQGQILPINQNQALFSLLGTTYGGDGRTTFALPDLRHLALKSPNGGSVHYVICTVGVFPSRN